MSGRKDEKIMVHPWRMSEGMESGDPAAMAVGAMAGVQHRSLGLRLAGESHVSNAENQHGTRLVKLICRLVDDTA